MSSRRIGRGPGSGLGKTAGRGHKGQYARSGGSITPGFEGGQSNLARRFPKFGMKKDRFNNYEPLTQLNLGHLAYHIQKGNLDTSSPITMRDLMEAGVVSKIQHGIKLLGGGA